MAEGVDYSWARPGGGTLKNAGKSFAVRYLYPDGQGGKGLDPSELADLQANGIEVPVVFESYAARAKEGRAAGQADARTAQAALVAVGLPSGMPIYFAVDYDAPESDQGAIDEYLRGAADVIGSDRVGVYAGYWIVKRCSENGTAKWLWQTYAWSGGNWFPGNHIEQYKNGQDLNGAVDFNRSKQDNYGQPSKFGAAAPVQDTPPAQSYQPPADATPYVAVRGDSMSAIAARHNMTLATLISLNPNAGHPAHNYGNIWPGDQFNVGGQAVPAGPAPTQERYDQVQPGGSMSAVAAANGISLARIKELNPNAGHPAGNFDLVYAGDRLRVA